MGDFVNQMVPIPMETVPPRPQRVSSSTGLRGLGTQGSAFESARRALQRQQCLFLCEPLCLPNGNQMCSSSQSRGRAAARLATHFAGRGMEKGGSFLPARAPSSAPCPEPLSPSSEPLQWAVAALHLSPAGRTHGPAPGRCRPPQGSRARGAENRGPGDVGAKPCSTPASPSQAPVPNTRGRGPRDTIGCHCDTRDPALRVPGAGLRGCVEGSAPAGKAFKRARGELGTNSLFRSGYQHQPNAPRDRFKISSQSTAPGRGERHPTPRSIHLPPVRQRNSGPDVRCRAVSPQTKRAPTASCPKPTPGRRERRGRFRSLCVGRTCVAVIAGPGQGAGNRSLPVQHMLGLEAGSYTGTLPASAPSAQSAAGGKNCPLGSSGQLPPAFLISLGWGQICHVPVSTLSPGVEI